MATTIKAKQFYAYQNVAVGVRTIIAMAADTSGTVSLSNNIVYWDANSVAQSIFTPATGATNLRSVFSRDFEYFTDGVAADLQKWDYVDGLSQWGITQPVTSLTVGALSAGLITLLTGRRYYVAYYNNALQDYSDLSPISVSTGALTLQQVALSSIPVASGTYVDYKLILATADGGDPSVLYELAVLTNATTTYADNTPEVTLLEANVWQYTDPAGVDHGLAGNQPPPNGSYPIKHQGRLFMANGQQLQFSKSLDELITSTGNIAGMYESCWPIENAIDISESAEQIRGLLSDGTVLYIGTESQIHSLTGNSPENFGQPTIVHSNTGLLTQNVWQVVYLEDTPIGTMWVTPDLRCLGSDFNTYENLGTPIQSTLNTINPLATQNAWAMYVGDGPYNFYILAIPTGTNTVPDTLCIFDLHLRKWFIWKMADAFSAGIFYTNFSGVARWIMCDNSGTIRMMDPTATLDRQNDPDQTGITSTIRTSWLDLGEASTRKSLNEMEVETSDPLLAVTIEGASTTSTFKSPVNTLVSSLAPTLSQFNEYKIFLAGTIAKDRFYRIEATSVSSATSTTDDVILGAINVEVIPINRN